MSPVSCRCIAYCTQPIGEDEINPLVTDLQYLASMAKISIPKKEGIIEKNSTKKLIGL